MAGHDPNEGLRSQSGAPLDPRPFGRSKTMKPRKFLLVLAVLSLVAFLFFMLIVVLYYLGGGH